MTFHIDRNRYETTDFAFTGMPQEQNKPDVPPDAKILFDVTVVEDLSGELRRAVSEHTFWCDISHGHYAFKLRDCRLTEPLSDHDWGNHRVRLSFETLRQNVLEAQRPLAPPPPPDHADVFLSQLHILSQEHDLIRRKRIQLARAYEELDAHKAKIDEAEKALDVRKAALFATGTPELNLMAKNRGL